MLSETSFLLSELDRRMAQMIRLGTVAEVDSQAAKVRVKLGENLTGWRPWIGTAGSIKVWRPPVVGEQVVVLSPGGDFEQSVILPSVFYSKFQSPSDDGDLACLALDEQNVLMWDQVKKNLKVALSDEASFELDCGHDSWMAFDNTVFAFCQKSVDIQIEDARIRLRKEDQIVDIDDQGVRAQVKGTSLQVEDGAIVLKVGGQTLRLDATGLTLNGIPLGGLA